MEEKPRYSRVSDIVDLAVYMSGKADGVTISEIAKRYNICRRTAERMRNSLTCIFPQIDEIDCGDNQKHWGFVNYSINNFVSFSPSEISSLEQIMLKTTNCELKKNLTKIIEKINSLNYRNPNCAKINIELSMQTEGYAVRQVPQFNIDIKTLEIIRDAVQNSKMIIGIYHDKERLLEPLGIIYGQKTYLVAREKIKGKDIYNYLLHKFSDLKLTEHKFDRGDFNLQDYTNQSFGVYHGEILDVELLFSPKLAPDASKYDFHPTQKFKWLDDGSLLVSFKASGSLEIMRHVFKWGVGCKIVAPKSLQDEYKAYLQKTINNY